jgi:Short-chain dehydrogenases of various substrate specificities
MNQKLGAVSRDRGQSRAGTATRNVVLVTGGSRGLGAELVSGFLARRYAVATLSRSQNGVHRANAARAAKKGILLVGDGCSRWRGAARLRHGGGRAIWPDRRSRQQPGHGGRGRSADHADTGYRRSRGGEFDRGARAVTGVFAGDAAAGSRMHRQYLVRECRSWTCGRRGSTARPRPGWTA